MKQVCFCFFAKRNINNVNVYYDYSRLHFYICIAKYMLKYKLKEDYKAFSPLLFSLNFAIKSFPKTGHSELTNTKYVVPQSNISSLD